MQNFADRCFSRLVLGIWLLAVCGILFVSREAISTWKMGDPDDQMRLLQVRDWVAGQSWWDITQYRMNAPDGGDMHWSRLVDVPIGLVIILLQPMLGQGLAEQAAVTFVPLLTLVAAMFFYALAVRRIFGPLTAIVASGLILTLTPFVAQMAPMRIDHHGWQLVCFLAGLWALFDQHGSKWSAPILGLSCALWIEISVEGLPFAALLLGVSGLGWIFPKMSISPLGNRQFPIVMMSIAIGTLLLFSATQGWAGPNVCDALSLVHIAVFGIMAATVAGGALLACARPQLGIFNVRLATCVAAALAGFAALRTMAPTCALDAFGSLDPLVREYWFVRVPEGLPLWSLPIDMTAQLYVHLVAGGLAFVYIVFFGRKIESANKLQLVLLYIGTIVIGTFVSRTVVYAMIIANMTLAATLVDLFKVADAWRSVFRRMGLWISALLLTMPSVFAQFAMNTHIAVKAASDPASNAVELKFQTQAALCQKSSSTAALVQLPPSNIMAGLDTNPAILQFTQHRVVASGHHRNQAAMADVIRTFTGTPDQAARIIGAREIRFVVICDGSYELALYARQAPDGMLAQLRAGDVPKWLNRKPNIGPFQVFEVEQTYLPQEIWPS